MKNTLYIVSGITLLIIIFFSARYFITLLRYESKVKDILIEEIDTSINDGVYSGICDAYFIKSDVDVTIENHVITSIIFNEYVHNRGAAATVLLDDVVQNQSTMVDTIAGATSSSVVILASIENALSGKECGE